MSAVPDAPAAPPSTTTPRAGDRLGRYEIVRRLGAGGFGTVYEALLRGPGGFERRVALKVLTAGGDGLRREARLGGLLRHTHLVDVYEVGEQDGVWFCALELCDGTLELRPPLSRRAVVEIGLQVCDALAYAHEELGLVHLDLKPANLLLRGAIVKVGDLGLSIARGFEGDLRASGTKGYVSPERRRGEPADPRADVYALGVVLTELAGGGGPAASDTFALDDGDAADPEAPWTTTGAGWLDAVVERCCAPDPADRFPSMRALADALRELAVDGPPLRACLGLEAPAPPPATRARTNLAPEAPVVGRGVAGRALLAHLSAPGLYTLKGPGGMGKTRLARAVAVAWHQETGGEAWFCDLSQIDACDALLGAVARVLDLPLRGAPDAAADAIGRALRGRGPLLLLLDNFEQLVDHASVVAAWCRAAREVRVLVTSREPLRVDGEAVVELPPLGLDASVALLREVAARRGVTLAEDGPALELARRLDGLPLALELAAGRLGVLSVEEVTERLSLSLLRGASVGNERHTTLRGTLDWSFGLLGEVEQRALAGLSVFVGGFSLEAAESVLALGPDAPWVVEVVERLVDRSLVAPGEHGRFSLLLTVREYALEQLGQQGRRAEHEARHTAWFGRSGTREGVRALYVHGGDARARALSVELENLVAAASRADGGDASVHAALAAAELFELRGNIAPWLAVLTAVAPRCDGDLSARVSMALGRACDAAGRPLDGIAHCRAAIETWQRLGDRGSEAVARALMASFWVSMRPEEARAEAEAAQAVLREVGDRSAEAAALGTLGVVHRFQGRLGEARAVYETALRMLAEVGNRRAEVTILGNLAIVARSQSRYDEAAALYERALAAHREVRDRRSEVHELGNVGLLRFDQGRLREARAAFETALTLHRELGDPSGEARVRGHLGLVERREGRPEVAQRHYEAALAGLRETGDRRLEATVLCNLGNLHQEAGRSVLARTLYDEALAVHRALGNRRSGAVVLVNLARVLLDEGAGDAAVATVSEALDTFVALDDPRGIGIATSVLAIVTHDQGRLPEAAAHYARALELHRSTRFAEGEAEVLGKFAQLELDRERPEEACVHAAAAVRVEAGLDGSTLGATLHAVAAEALAAAGDLAGARAAVAEARTRLVGRVESRHDVVVGCAEVRVARATGDAEGAAAALAAVEAVAGRVYLGPDLERRLVALRG